MTRTLRIGTRDSQLALWQAEQVQAHLTSKGHLSELAPQKSDGDLTLDKPLYELGITGIFTRTLDIALLEERVDIAVHSLKDVPTRLPHGLCLAAVLERGPRADILVLGEDNRDISTDQVAQIATGSLRRQAQWLHRYPSHHMENLRGNVQTRLKKLRINGWNGAIFAEAGLARMDLLKDLNWQRLDWMLPAPAQGIIGLVCRADDLSCRDMLSHLSHQPTFVEAQIERSFMRRLEGGCTAPIGAQASVVGEQYVLTGNVLSLNGQKKIAHHWAEAYTNPQSFGEACANELLKLGAEEILTDIRLNE